MLKILIPGAVLSLTSILTFPFWFQDEPKPQTRIVDALREVPQEEDPTVPRPDIVESLREAATSAGQTPNEHAISVLAKGLTKLLQQDPPKEPAKDLYAVEVASIVFLEGKLVLQMRIISTGK